MSLRWSVRRRAFEWFARRYKELDHLEEYFPLVFTRWQAVLWGGSLLAVVWGITFIVLNSLPAWLTWVNWVAIIIALFFAGYYVWRPYHVRLIPKLTIGPIELIYSSPKGPSVSEKRRFVQVVVNCATECPLESCRGKLLSVSRWSDGKWEPTRIGESMDLWWSHIDGPTLLLEDGAPQRLNVFYVENTSRDIFTWTKIPVKQAYSPSDILRFDVRVAANNCPAEYIYFKVTFGDQWCDVYPEITKNDTFLTPVQSPRQASPDTADPNPAP